MKNIIYFILSSFLSLNAFAETQCSHQIVESTGTIYITPAYEAKAIYFFDDQDKIAYAIVYWNLNYDVSKECIKMIDIAYPSLKKKIAGLRVNNLSAKVFKGLNSQDLIIYPEAGGFYNGSTDKINVDYKSKNEIKKAIEQKKDLISINGDITYQITISERGLLGHVSCLGKEPLKGVTGLHTRLGELITLINSRPKEEKLSKEEILDQFMTSCVQFNDIDSTSLQNFEASFIRKTMLIKGSVPFYGMKEVEKEVKTWAITVQESTAVEY
jgi:hypothetical protein